MNCITINNRKYFLSRKDILEKIDIEELKEKIDTIINESEDYFYEEEINKENINNEYYLTIKGFVASSGEDIKKIIMKL